jgi:hypothetical protein
MSYLLVPGIAGAAGALVAPGAGALASSLLQPVTKAPAMRHNSAIRVYVLFIVPVIFTITPKKTSTFLLV